jgi:uncharacterized damage-inducible protein DinB
MDKATMDQLWDQFRQKYGVYLRLLEEFPEKQYHTHPVKGMRTPAQLVAHVSGSVVRDIAQGIAKGAITADESEEDSVAAGFKTRKDMLSFARKCWDDANAAVEGIGDAQLQAVVSTPWNMSFPGWVGFHIMGDEFLHHRGQLYAFARVCGVQPPFIWGFDQNAPDFQP